MSISQEYGREFEREDGSKKARRPQNFDSEGLFDEARTQLSRKKEGEEVVPKGKYTFTEFNPNAQGLRKGGKKGSNKFKSKSKHKRR